MNTDSFTHDLPEGWALPTIGECVELKYGKGLPNRKRVQGAVAVYGSNGVVGSHNQAVTDGQTIIIGRKGTVGAVHYSGSPCWPIDTTYFIDEFYGLNPAYLTHGLRYLDLARLESSTAIPGLNRNDIYNERFPLAPLPEQDRIAAKLEELLSTIEKTKKHIEKVPQIVTNFRKAVLNAVCSGRLTEEWREKHPDIQPASVFVESFITKQERRTLSKSNSYYEQHTLPETWIWMPFEKLVSNWDGKRIPVKASDRKVRHGPYPYYGASGIIDCIDDYLFEGDHLLIGEDGANLLARSKPIAFIASGKFWVNNHAHVLRTLGGIPLEYLEIFINSIDLQPYVTGTAQPKLTQRNMNTILVPVPPLEEQEEIVCRVEGLFKLADSIEKRVRISATKAFKLTQSILSKAFRGELLPTEAELARRQGRTYETAEQLLARIKLEREKKRTIELKVSGKIKVRSKVMGVLRGLKKRPILEVLSEAQGKLKPEELFRKANFTEEFVDDFYEELREAVQAEQIKELRPNKTEIYLKAVKT